MLPCTLFMTPQELQLLTDHANAIEDDLRELSVVLSLLEEVTLAHRKMFGMTPMTKLLVEAFYLLQIRCNEMALREWEANKDRLDTDAEQITRFATAGAELDALRSEYEHFLRTGEIDDGQ
jgi:hypothetical protein